MKKIYTTLMIVLCATIAFSQVSAPGSKATSGNFWYSYVDAFANDQYPSQLEDAFQVVTNDTSNYYYTNIDGLKQRPVNYALGCTFDFLSTEWVELYSGYGNGGVVPIFTQESTYSVDSVSIQFRYVRYNNQPADEVDTLIVCVAAQEIVTDTTFRVLGNMQTGVNFFLNTNNMYYDFENGVFRNTAEDPYNGNYEMFKIPLPTLGYDSIDLPSTITQLIGLANFQNLPSTHLMQVLYTMKSGSPIPANDSIIAAVNGAHFSAWGCQDNRPEYITPSTAQLLSQTNTTIVANSMSHMTPDYRLQGKVNNFAQYVLVAAYDYYFRPNIKLNVKCDDCDAESTKNFETKTINVRPNPATSKFTVELADAGTAQVELFNLVGQLVYSEQTTNTSVEVNVNNLNKGVYMLKINQNGKVYTSKVVVR